MQDEERFVYLGQLSDQETEERYLGFLGKTDASLKLLHEQKKAASILAELPFGDYIRTQLVTERHTGYALGYKRGVSVGLTRAVTQPRQTRGQLARAKIVWLLVFCLMSGGAVYSLLSLFTALGSGRNWTAYLSALCVTFFVVLEGVALLRLVQFVLDAVLRDEDDIDFEPPDEIYGEEDKKTIEEFLGQF